MKRLFLLVILALFFTGCHPTPEPSAVTPESAEPAAESVPEPIAEAQAEPVREAVVGDKWEFFYKERRDEAKLNVYKRALQLLKDQLDVNGTLSSISRHIGDWYLIIVEIEDKTPPEMIPLDAPAPQTEFAYLVDMAAEKVIRPGDWIAARPFYRGLHLERHTPSADPEAEKEYLGSIAATLSAVSFSHTRYIEPITGQQFPEGVGGPRLSIGANGAVFTYYIASTGMMYFFT